MSKPVKSSLDFNRNEIQNVVVQKLATAPTSPVAGLAYFDTTLGYFRYHNGTVWVSCRETPNVSSVGTGTALHNGIVANAIEFRTIKSANSLLAMTNDGSTIMLTVSVSKSDVGLGNVTNDAQLKVADLDTDGNLAANSDSKIASQKAVKTYVENKLSGKSWKDSVRAGTTGNIALSGAQTIDGIAVVSGDRVLVKNQTAAANNGIYVVAAGAWTRSTDNDSNVEMVNASVMIEEGTTLADTQWTCSTNAPITLGGTSLTFVQTGGPGSVVGGDGIVVTGNSIAVDSSVTRNSASQTLTNKTLNADNNTISELETDNFKAGVIDADTALAGNSDTKIPTQKAVKGYADTKLAGKTNYYKGDFAAATTLSVAAATHLCGLAPHVQVYEVVGSVASLVEVEVAVNTGTGAVTFTSSTAFTGYMVIIGK